MLGLQAPEKPGKPEETDNVQLSPDGKRHRRTVLVIDDEVALLAIISDVLEESGFEVLTVSDGPAGLAILSSDQAIDLLITDIRLPKGMNGRQVAEAARGLRPQLKILFMTGFAGSAFDGAGPADRATEVMTKPFDLGRLADRVRALVET